MIKESMKTGNEELIVVELALSFSEADALRIKKYAAKKNMSILDYAKHAVMKSIDEEDSLTEQNAAMIALKGIQKDMEGVGEAIGLDSDDAVAAWVTESRREERAAK